MALLCILLSIQELNGSIIVTTFTTPKHQNEDEDGDGDAVLRHVAAYVDDVTSL